MMKRFANSLVGVQNDPVAFYLVSPSLAFPDGSLKELISQQVDIDSFFLLLT